MFKSSDQHSVKSMHFTNYPRQTYLITSCGGKKKEILFILELFYWTNIFAFSKEVFCLLLCGRISYYRTWNFSFKPAFHILEEVPNGHPRAWNIPFIHNVYKSFTGLHNHMTQTWALLSHTQMCLWWNRNVWLLSGSTLDVSGRVSLVS